MSRPALKEFSVIVRYAGEEKDGRETLAEARKFVFSRVNEVLEKRTNSKN